MSMSEQETSEHILLPTLKQVVTEPLSFAGPCTVRLVDEKDPEGPVVFLNSQGSPVMQMDQGTYQAVKELHDEVAG